MPYDEAATKLAKMKQALQKQATGGQYGTANTRQQKAIKSTLRQSPAATTKPPRRV
jgi:hypothetical protein